MACAISGTTMNASSAVANPPKPRQRSVCVANASKPMSSGVWNVLKSRRTLSGIRTE